MKHTTFLIVYSRDSQDRMENLHAVSGWLGNVGANILIKELPTDKPFHRTKAFNDLARGVKTPVIVLTDTDCIIEPKENLQRSEDMIVLGEYDFVFPFNSPNHSVPKSGHEQFLYGPRGMSGIKPIGSIAPCGGLVFCSRDAYWKSGGENEKLIGWTPDDQERLCRWEKLGYKTISLSGKIYHLDHEITLGRDNPFYEAGEKEFQKVKSMTREELEAYIKTWEWAK